MKVLSLFDGISCGQLALNRAGIPYDIYFASEVDPYAIAVTQHHFPKTRQLGDVSRVESCKLPEIDLLMGGSPCQNFSTAGTMSGMTTTTSIEILTLEQYLDVKESGFVFQGQSYLFWEFVRLLVEVKPKYFLLENVKMAGKWEQILTNTLRKHAGMPDTWGPILINSSLVSAQNRERYYWTNIPNVTQPEDQGIVLKDVLDATLPASIPKNNRYAPRDVRSDYIDPFNQKNIAGEKSTSLRTNSSNGNMWVKGCIQVGQATNINGYDCLKRVYSPEGKAPTLTSCNGGNREPKVSLDMRAASIVGRKLNESGLRDDSSTNIPLQQYLEVGTNPTKSRCVTTVEKDCLISSLPEGRYADPYGTLKDELYWRRLTPVECERLQTVPDNYTLVPWKNRMMSNSRRYKMLGNGWTVDVIAHIFSFIIT